MGSGCTKENQNIYFRARKRAAMYNDKLSSREGASELLGISPSTLADYELGITKFVPVDKVVLMADLYNCPELRAAYCKNECPIGKHIQLATTIDSLEMIAVRLLKCFGNDEIETLKSRLIDIVVDGDIEEDNEDLKDIIKQLDKITLVVSELKMAVEKRIGESR